MAFYNLAQTQSHKRYLVIKTARRKRNADTEIIDWTLCRRCSVPCCDKRRCRKAWR